MIAPANRLFTAAALVVLPLATVAGALPAALPFAGSVLGLLAAAVAADLALSRARVVGVAVLLPQLVRGRERRPATLSAELEGVGCVRRIRLALAVPPGCSSELAELRLEIPEGHDHARCAWTVTPIRRGRYRFERCDLEIPSRFGFWQLRRTVAVATELRVYPDLASSRREVAAELIRREGVGSRFVQRIGKGREVDHLRHYQPGDDYDDIHWRATARRGEPVVKVHRLERTQEIYVALDASRLLGRRCGELSAFERFLRAALVLAEVARRRGDRFGLLVFSDRVHRFVPAGGGPAHYDACREALYAEQVRAASPDFDELATAVARRIRRRALLLVLTDFGEARIAEGFERAAATIAQRHLVMAFQFARETAAPIFARTVEEDADVLDRLAGHLAWQRSEELRMQLARIGVSLAPVASRQPVAEITARYLEVKTRQLL